MSKFASLLHRAAARTLSAWEGAREPRQRRTGRSPTHARSRPERAVPFKRRLLFEALEPRVLLSADLLPGVAPAALMQPAGSDAPRVDLTPMAGLPVLQLHASGALEAGAYVADTMSGTTSGQPSALPFSQEYRVDLAAGQTISLVGAVDSQGYGGRYTVTLTIADAGDSTVASADGADGAQIQTFAAPAAGTYTVTLGIGADDGEGDYLDSIGWTLDAAVGAAIEVESRLPGAADNGWIGDAQWLGDLQPLPIPGAARTAVVGRLTPHGDGRTDADLYRIDLAAGESIQVETTLSNELGFFHLLDANGNLVASADHTGQYKQWDGPLGLPQFVADADGTYYLKVDLWWDSGRAPDPIDYTIVVARNASLDPDSHTELGLGGTDPFAVQLGAIVHSGSASAAAASGEISPASTAESSAGRFDATVTAGTVVLLIVPIADAVIGGPGVVPEVRVYDADGNELQVDATSVSAGYGFEVSANIGDRISILIRSDWDGQFVLAVQGAQGDNPPPAVAPGTFGRGIVGSTNPWQNLILSEPYRADAFGDVRLLDAEGNDLGALPLYPWWSDLGVTVKLPDDLPEGDYRIAGAAGAFVDLTGQPSEPFDFAFSVDAQRPQLVSPAAGETPEIGTDQTIVLTFDEPMASYWPDASFFDVAGNPVAANWDSQWSPDGLTLTIHLQDTLDQGSYELRLSAWVLQDVAGNQYDADPSTPEVDPLVLRFSVDADTYAMPQLFAREPLGALVYASSVNAALSSSGDSDDFTIDLDAGVAFTATVAAKLGQAANTLPAVQLQVFDPDDNLVAETTASAAGRAVMIPDIATGDAAGTWRLRVSSPTGDIGDYAVSVVVGATVEREFTEIDGVLQGADGTRAGAEDLDPSSLVLAPGIDRLAGVGRFAPGRDPAGGATTDPDYYRFTLDAGQSASIVLAVEGPAVVGSLRLGLFDDAGDLDTDPGTRLAAATGSANADRVILDYTNHETSPVTLYARASAGSAVRYAIVVTRGATFDVGAIGGVAQALGPTGAVLGASGGAFGGSGGAADQPGTPTTGATLYDGGGYRWDVYNGDGVVWDGTSDAYDGGEHLRISDPASGINDWEFGAERGTLSADGRTLWLTRTVNNDLRVDRRIYVPAGDGFARYLDQVTNSGATARTVTLTLQSNFGSDSATQLMATDEAPIAVFDASDHWLATDDYDGTGDPSLAHVSWGPGGQAPDSATLVRDNLTRSWQITIAPGQTVGLLHYAVQGPNQATVQATAKRLVALPPEAVAGLSPAEMASVANFGQSDPYRLWVNAGDHLEIGVQRVGRDALPLRLRMIDPQGVVQLDTGVASGPMDGLSAGLEAQTAGQWTIQLLTGQARGEYLLQASGATGTPPVPHVVSSTPAAGQFVNALPASIDIQFDTFVRADSVQPEDLELDQALLDAGAEVTSVEPVNGRTLRFHLSGAPSLAEGDYGWSIAGGAVVGFDGQGNAAANGGFTVDTTPPQGLASWPDDQRAPLEAIVLTFSESIDPASVSIADIASFTGPGGVDLRSRVTGVSVDGDQITVNIATQWTAGEYRLTIGPDVRDLAGNPLDQNGNGVPGEAVDDAFTAVVRLRQIDLVVTSIALPERFQTGQEAQLSWTVANAGDIALSAGSGWYDEVWLVRPDGSQWYYAGEFYHYLEEDLAAGGSVTVTQPVTVWLDSGIPEGDYRVAVMTDAYNWEPEQDERNNTLTSVDTVPLEVVAPDLTPVSIGAPAEAAMGDTITVSWQARNSGNAPLAGWWYDQVQLVDPTSNSAVYAQDVYRYHDLAVDAAYADQLDITLPVIEALAHGEYIVRLVVDAYNYQLEGDEGNNTLDAPQRLTIAVPPLSDLVVSSLTTDAISVAANTDLNVTWTVTNQGAASTGSGFYDRLWLVNANGSATYLTDVYRDALAAGASATRSQAIRVPYNLPVGTYRLRVTTDAFNYVNELLNEGNNTTESAPLQVTTAIVADLQIQAITPPGSITLGSPVTVTWTGVNSGNGSVAAGTGWYDRVDLVDAGGTTRYSVNASSQPAGGVVAGATYAGSLTFTPPVDPSLPEGNYRVRVTSDAYGYVIESNDGNNALLDSTLIPLTAPPTPDLVPASVAVPASAPANTRITVTWQDRNQGDAETGRGYYDLVQLVNAGNGSIYNSWLTPYFDQPATIAAGAAAARSFELLLPASMPPGTYKVRVTSDYYNYIPEYDGESNNVVDSANFSVTEALRADLRNVRIDTALPAGASFGGTLNLTYSVDNGGTGSTQNVQWIDRVQLVRASDQSVVSSVDIGAGNTTTGVAAGGSYSNTVALALPLQAGVETGDYQVKVLTDVYNNLNESDRSNNNFVSAPLHLTVPPLANLVVRNVSAPAAATSGTPIDVSWTTANIGDGGLFLRSAGANYFYDRVYLADSAGNPIQALGTFRVDGPFPAGSTLDRVQRVTIPDTVANGSYTIVVRTDDAQAWYGYDFVNEHDFEGDNAAVSASITITQPPRVDLQVDTVVVPAAAATGSALTVRWTTHNAGTAGFSGSFNEQVQVSTAADFSVNLRTLAPTARFTGEIAAGASVERSADVIVPIDLNGANDVSKVWYLRVVTDTSGEVYEYDLENNNASVPASLTLTRPALPDLVVASVDAPDAAVAGTDVVVTYTVTNNGSASAGGRTDRIALVREDGTLWTLWTDKRVDDPLAAGASQTFEVRFTLPVASGNTGFSGRLRAQVQTDVSNDVVEYPYDNNNTLADQNQLVVTLPPLPNLAVTDIVAPAEALTEASIPLRWTVANLGPAPTGSGWTDQVYLSADGVLDGSDRLIGSYAIDTSLAAGASIERVQTVELPRELVGTYRVIVRTDANGNLFEGAAGEADNVTADAQTLTIRQRPLPNLVVSAVTPPENAFSGQEAVVGWTVHNIGTGSTTVPVWYDAVYLSADDTLDGSDTLLATAVNPGFLDAGGSYANAATFTLPRGIDGNYRFIVVTDVYNGLYEGASGSAAEKDNTSAPATARVTLTPPPDLQVASVTPIAQAFSGQPVTLNWQVVNAGDGRTRETSWYDRVYLSSDATLDGSDTVLGDVRHAGALDAGESYKGNLNAQLPIGVSGSWYFIVATDVFNQVYEHTLENNNTRAEADPTQILLTPPPDLEVVSTQFPASARAGTDFTVRFRVENLGATETPAQQPWWYDQAWLSLDDNVDPYDLALGAAWHYGTLEPEGGYDGAITATLPAGLSGTYKLLLRTDAGNAVFEGTAGETNNTIVAGTVDVYQSRPDLVVGDFTMPASVEAGRTATFSWTVRNQGSGDTIAQNWTDSLWASLDDTIGNGDDVLIGNVGHAGVVAPGGSYTVEVAPVVPFSLSGAGRFYVRADSGAQVTESNEANNLSRIVLADIVRHEADLVVTESSATPVAGDDRSFDLHFVVRNDGVATTNVNTWVDGIWLSADSTLGAGDTRLRTVFRGNPLAAGASYAVDVRVAVPSGFAAGDYKVIVRADDDNAVVEGAGEGNNTAVAAVTVGPLVVRHPDLTVTSVTAPDAAISGQPITVQWTVRNQSGDDAISPYWWYGAYDQVYLSSDAFLDSSDLSLGYVSWNSQAAGTDVTRSLTANLPPGRSGLYYVLVKTDAGNLFDENGAEGNNVGYTPNLMEVALAPPADLVAGEITLPANAVPGQAMDVTYTVANASGNAAQGSWRDVLYLSKDDVFDTSDVVFGSADIYGPIAANGSYTRTVHATVPGVDPGSYKLIVRTDVRNVLPEASEANNLAASVDAVRLDVPSLTLGVPAGGTIGAGQSLFFKVEVGAGEALRFTLDGPGSDVANDMWVGFESMPSRSRNDVGTGEQFTPDPVLTVPTTAAGTYYVRIDASAFAGGAYSLRADLVPFAVEKVSKDTVGNRGEATVRIDGARFDASTVFELRGADGSVNRAVEVNLKDAGRAYVTFDLYGVAAGTYDLRALRTVAGGATVQSTLVGAMHVVAGQGADAFITISGPSAVQVGRDASFYLNYSNDGDADTMAPLLIVTPSSGTTIGLSSKTLGQDALFILGTSLDGPLDLLRPGAHYSLPVAYRAPGQAGYLSIDARPVQSDSTEQITDWAAIERSLRPAGVDLAAWQPFWARVQPAIGATMGDLVQVLNDLAVRLSPAGDPVRDVRQLFALQLAADPNWMPARTVSGRLLASDDAGAVAGAEVQLLRQRGDGWQLAATATTGADGSFALSGVRPGTYYWALGSGQMDMDRDGLPDTTLAAVVVGADAPTDGGNLYRLRSDYDAPVVRQDSDAKLLVDSAGVAHMFWTRGDRLYHAWRGADGLWTDARPISEQPGANLSVAAGATLVGGQPGMIAVWEQGTGNDTQIFVSVGIAGAGGGYLWSRPEQITGEIVASYNPSVEIDGSGNAVVTFLRRDFAVQDDPDQYYAVLEIDPGALEWSTAAGTAGVPEAQAALEVAGTTKISVGWPSKDFGPYEIAGFSFKAGFEGTVSSTLDDQACTVTDALTGKGSLAFRVPEVGRVNFEGSASGNGNWYVDPNTQDWAFGGAQINAAASGSLEVKDGVFKVLQAFPATAPAAIALRRAMNWVSNYTGGAVRLENSIILGPFGFEANDLRWSTKAPFPVFLWPDSVGEFSIGGNIGLAGKAVVRAWDAEVSLQGSVGVKAKIYPSFKLDVGYTVTLQGKIAGWVLVNGEWAGSTTLAGSSLEALDGGAPNPTGDGDLIWVWDPAATLGTGNVYGSGAIDANVAANRLGESSLELARGADGSVWGLFARDGDAAAGEIGNRVMVTSLANGHWADAVALDGTLGFNSDGGLAVLADGSRLAVWSHASSSALTVTSSMDAVMAARKQSDLYFSVDSGSGFSPVTRFTMTSGSETSVALAKAADGRVVAAWVNDSGSEQVLYTAAWNGSGFGAATEVARTTGGVLSGVTIAVAGNQTLLAWNENSDPSDANHPITLRTATVDGGSVAASEFQTSAIDPAYDKVLAAPVDAAAAAGLATGSLAPQGGWPVFAVPEDCKKCTPDKLKKITEAAPDCRPGGGSETKIDTKKCEQKTITYAPCVTRPRDPNDIQGPDGFGDQNWIKAGDTFDYTIRFENAADATAPAQVVTVTQTLDDDLDPRSFRVGAFGFGDLTVTPEASRSFYSGRIDLRDSRGIYVDVTVNIDLATRVATWTLTTIDPETGQVPVDANKGFLPPDDETGRGQGFLGYSVKAVKGAATGTVVDAQARIVFDQEGPIDTPAIFHTLDADAPSSQVEALPATTDSNRFTVRWSGTDAEGGSAIRDYDVYVGRDGGAYTLWQYRTTDTEGVFEGEGGHTYAFYSLARDNAGNVEAAPASADATIHVLAQTGSVAGNVFNDIDFNGRQDDGEGAASGWTVYLDANANGALDEGEQSVVTGADGAWQFADLQPGDYRVAIEARSGWEVTTPAAGYFDLAVAAGDMLAGRAFGTLQLGSIAGTQFDDLNGNGVREAGEGGLEGWTVYIDANANGQLDAGERTTLTLADGSYRFDGLRPGTYQIGNLPQEGWIQTRPGTSGAGTSTAVAVTLAGSLASISLPSCACGGTVTALAAQQAGWDEQLVGLDQFRADPGYAGVDGSGVRVVVIDTGIDDTHPFFAGRIVYQYDFADNDALAADRSGHGTHVAGVIAGQDAMFGGVAPGADLIVLKVFGDDGSGSFANLERALQWVVANADAWSIGVVNLSLGDGLNWTSAGSRYGLGDEFAALAARGVITVAADGNAYATTNAIGVAYPAADPAVLAVGAVWAGDFGGPWKFGNGGVDYATAPDRIASFSQRDPDQTDVFAPGARLTSAAVGGGVRTMQGTSQAAAYVSGVAALAQELAQQHLGRKLTVGEFHDLLASTSVAINDGDDESDNVANTGLDYLRLDVGRLADAIVAMSPGAGSGGTGGTGGDAGPGEVKPAAGSGAITVELGAGEAYAGADFGVFKLGQVAGFVFDDRNADGVQQEGEAGIAGALVFVDANGNGSFDPGETSATTDADGHWALAGLNAGTIGIGTDLPAGWAFGAAGGTFTVTVTSGYEGSVGFGRYDLPPEANDDSATTVEAQSVAGNVLDNDRDPGRPDNSLLTVSLVAGPAHGTLTLGEDGAFTYTPGAGYEGSDSFRYAASDGVSSREATVSISVLHDSLRVGSFTQRHDGFEVAFSRPVATSGLELGGADADVVVADAAGNPVAGSLFIAADGRSARFLASGGVLADGSYSVRLRSGATALRDTAGVGLDGNGDGAPGDDYVGGFTVARGNALTVGLADTARGPGQLLGLAVGDTGLAVRLSNGAGVTAVGFTLAYDPALLGVATLARGTGLPSSASFSATATGSGLIEVRIEAPDGLPAGALTLAQLVATVPGGASYGAAGILDVRDLRVNGGAIAALDDDAVHVAAYPGDVNRDGKLTSADVAMMRDLLNGAIPRLAAWPLVDGRILGDVNGSGGFDGVDPMRLEQTLAGARGLMAPLPDNVLPAVQTPPPVVKVPAPPKIVVPIVTPKLSTPAPSWVAPLVSPSATISANVSIRVTV